MWTKVKVQIFFFFAIKMAGSIFFGKKKGFGSLIILILF